MRSRTHGQVLAAVLFALAAMAASAAAAQSTVAPSPKVVIYPGDIIADDALTEVTLDGSTPGGPFAISRDEIVGKAATRTLLPGRPISLRAVDNPRLVRNGHEVRLLYVDGGLTIMTTGSALQDGVVGDIVKVRNLDSGVTVGGEVRADGAVMVKGD